MAFKRIDIFLPFFVSHDSCGVILVFKPFEHLDGVPADQVAISANDHVHALVLLTFLDDNLSWIEGYIANNVVEFGPLRLGVAIKPQKLFEELRLDQIGS